MHLQGMARRATEVVMGGRGGGAERTFKAEGGRENGREGELECRVLGDQGQVSEQPAGRTGVRAPS